MTVSPLTSDSNKGLRAFSIILLLVAYLPARSVFSRLLMSVSPAQALAENFIEITILLLLGWLFLQRLRVGRGFVRTPLDIPLFLLFLVVLLSIIVNQRFNADAARNAVSFLRYISIYYLVVNLYISEKDITGLFSTIVLLGIGVSILTIILYFVPSLNAALEGFFQPIYKQSLKIGSVRGVFPTGELALYLLIALVVYLGLYRRKLSIINIAIFEVLIPALFIMGIFATYKRAALLLSLPVLWVFWTQQQFSRRSKTITQVLTYILFFFVFAGLLVVDLPQSVTETISSAGRHLDVRTVQVEVSTFLLQLFSPLYWQRVAIASRGWSVLVVVPRVLTSPYVLLGLSPDSEYMRLTLARHYSDLQRIVSYVGFEDVYWVALLTYYGILGLICFSFVLFRLFRLAKRIPLISTNSLHVQTSSIYRTLLMGFILFGFVERTPEIPSTSLLFWLFSGIMTRLYMQLRLQKGE